jgi:hypothetical protein
MSSKKKKNPHKLVNAQIARERAHPTHATPNLTPSQLKSKLRSRRRR